MHKETFPDVPSGCIAPLVAATVRKCLTRPSDFVRFFFFYATVRHCSCVSSNPSNGEKQGCFRRTCRKSIAFEFGGKEEQLSKGLYGDHFQQTSGQLKREKQYHNSNTILVEWK